MAVKDGFKETFIHVPTVWMGGVIAPTAIQSCGGMMKKLMKSVTAVAFAAMLAVGAAGCGATTDPAPAGGNEAPADAPKPAPKTDKPLTDDDDLAFAIGAAVSGEARWEGDALQVKLTEDQGVNGVRAFTKCKAIDLLIKDTQTAVLEFTDGTVACVDVLPE